MKQKRSMKKVLLIITMVLFMSAPQNIQKLQKKPYTITYNYNDKIKGESYGWLVA